MSIFISLNSENIENALCLKETLFKWGFNDVWTMKDIDGGGDWENKISDALNEACVCLLSVAKDGVTFTQGYEAGIAFGRGLKVIPTLHSGGKIKMLPSIIKHLQCRNIEDLGSDQSVLKSDLIIDLHPHFVTHTARQGIIDLTTLIVKAHLEFSTPKVANSEKEYLEVNTTKAHRKKGTKKSVATVTERQQQAALVSLTMHADSTAFLDSFYNKLDVRFQDKFNELVKGLRDHRVSDKVILRTCVLANSSALTVWKNLWDLTDS